MDGGMAAPAPEGACYVWKGYTTADRRVTGAMVARRAGEVRCIASARGAHFLRPLALPRPFAPWPHLLDIGYWH